MPESSAEALIMPRSKIRSCWSSTGSKTGVADGSARSVRSEYHQSESTLARPNNTFRHQPGSNILSMAMPFWRAFISGAGEIADVGFIREGKFRRL